MEVGVDAGELHNGLAYFTGIVWKTERKWLVPSALMLVMYGIPEEEFANTLFEYEVYCATRRASPDKSTLIIRDSVTSFRC